MYRSLADLPATLDSSFALLSRASADLLDAIAAFDEQQGWIEDGATSMTSWLAARYAMSWGVAREWVRVAHALRDLPAIRHAFVQGSLSFDQLKPLTRFVSADEDERWAHRAQDLSPGRLWGEVRRRERRTREQAEEDATARYLWMGWDEDRTVLHLEGMLPAEQGAVVEAALESAAENITVEPGVRDPRGAGLADALTSLVASSDGAPNVACVVVHADAAVLADVPADSNGCLAETDSGVSLAPQAVQRLGCDSRIEWVLERDGVPVGTGRGSRTVPPWLLRLLRHRDGNECRFPGCGHRRWLKAHHIEHWARGGPTDLDNLVLLCHAHHRLVHEGGWSIHGHPAGKLRFHDPTGRRRPSRPPPNRSTAAA
jgi:Domain of unknown function (DUF222)/HNH endonuclease